MKIRPFATFCVSLLLPICRSAASEPMLIKTEVVRLADAAGKHSGHHLTHYIRNAPRYEFVSKDKTWTVVYESKPDRGGMVRLGDYFFVIVEDRTKKVRVAEGH